MFDERNQECERSVATVTGTVMGTVTGTVTVGDAVAHVGRRGEDWRVIDRSLRRVAARRAALDVEEAALLVAAQRAEVHKALGMGSFGEYLERVLGYAPTTARDRLRVATALETLPAIRGALAAGEVSFSAVREITRVATPETERRWLARIEGVTVREVEDAVRGHAPGDDPDDRPDPDLVPRVLRMELAQATYALFLEARRHLERVTGSSMTDDEFLAAACRGVIADGADTGTRTATETHSGTGSGSGSDSGSGPGSGSDSGSGSGSGSGPETGSGREHGAGEGARATSARRSNQPPHQISLSVCPECRRGWHDVPGRSIEIGPAAIEQAWCDAVILGRVDGETTEQAQRTVPAATRRQVMARDHERCTVPGCTSWQYVDVHHLTPRSIVVDHRPGNLTVLCSTHHRALHEGRLVIEGEAPTLRFFDHAGRTYGSAAHVGSRPQVARSSGPG